MPRTPQRILARVMAAGACLLVTLAGAAPQRGGLKVGQPAPDFVLNDLQGDSVRLSQFKGHPVVLKFWATWCPTCRTEMPELLEARRAHEDAGLVVLTVDSDDRPAKIPRFLATIPGAADLVVLVDGKRRVQDQYRIVVLPTTVFVDTLGDVTVVHAGALTADQLIAGLRTIL